MLCFSGTFSMIIIIAKIGVSWTEFGVGMSNGRVFQRFWGSTGRDRPVEIVDQTPGYVPSTNTYL